MMPGWRIVARAASCRGRLLKTVVPDKTNEQAVDQSTSEAIEKVKEAASRAIDGARQSIIEAIDRAKQRVGSALETAQGASKGALDRATEGVRILDKLSDATREVLDKAKQAAEGKARDVTPRFEDVAYEAGV